MSMLKPHVNFASRWGDDESLNRFRTSTKSKEIIILNCENALKDMVQRFDRSPMQVTLSWWARDLVDAGCDDLILREVFKSIPYKFERCPTLAQLMELIRPYLAKKESSGSDLDKYTSLVKTHAKAKFKSLLGDDVVNRMISYYKKEVCEEFTGFDEEQYLLCLVLDWIRAYCPNQPQKIIEQGKISNQKALEKDVDYFLLPLKRYAKENNLSVNDF